MAKSVDIIVVGGGPGGYVAAIRAAQLGAKVALVHNDDLGGTCLNRGCIPSKALIHCAATLQNAKAGKALGITFGDPQVDFDKVRAHKDRTVKGLVSGVKALIKSNGIASAGGKGILTGPNEVTVEAGGEVKGVLSAPRIIWATGSLPSVPPIPGADGEGVITSDNGVDLPGPPAEIAIIGGGAVGSEFAYIYSQFGTKVHLIEMMETIVPAEEPEVGKLLAGELKKSGCQIYTGARCNEISDVNGRKRVEYEMGGEVGAIEVDLVMMAAGRRANTAGMGLDEVGVEMDRGRVQVNSDLQTSIEGLYAIGDCVRGIGLAHQASHEGMAAVEVALGEAEHVHDFVVPAVTYTHPELASVGLREAAAIEAGYEVKVGKFPFQALGKSAAIRERLGFVKLIGDAKTDTLLGASIVGTEASDLIAELTLGIQAGVTMSDVAGTCHAHPSLAEAVGEAALDALGRSVHLPPQD